MNEEACQSPFSVGVAGDKTKSDARRSVSIRWLKAGIFAPCGSMPGKAWYNRRLVAAVAE